MKDDGPAKKISKRECGRLIRGKLRKIDMKEETKAFSYDRIQELLNESSVECSVCL